jgi:hypothetical protein
MLKITTSLYLWDFILYSDSSTVCMILEVGVQTRSKLSSIGDIRSFVVKYFVFYSVLLLVSQSFVQYSTNAWFD